jgi:hypothetical protein
VESITQKRGATISASAASSTFEDSRSQVPPTVSDRAARDPAPAFLGDRPHHVLDDGGIGLR